MAYVKRYSETVDDTVATSFTAPLPEHQAGDLLIVAFQAANTTTLTTTAP
jgi:hypothetical protein